MPLKVGSDPDTISANIAELVKAGHSQKQAAAIAYKEAGKGASDAEPIDFTSLFNQFLSSAAWWEKKPAHLAFNCTLGADMAPADWEGLVNGFLKFVGEEVEEPEHKEGKPIAAGIIFECGDKVLLLKRSLDEENYAGYWSIPGGGIEEGEDPLTAALREAREEMSYSPDGEAVVVMTPHITTLPLGDLHLTYRCPLKEEFTPTLNAEHTEHQWASRGELPKPLHPGVKAALTDKVVAKDGWYAMAADRAIGPFNTVDNAKRAAQLAAGRKPDHLAFDKSSTRTETIDGHMRVETNNISKACVSPYLGSEIPHCKELGLEPDKIYKLLRDPEELAKAAPTFRGVPLLIEHIPVKADDHPHQEVVGTIGTEVIFEAPYLKAPLVIWTKEGSDAVKSEDQQELSSGYHYTPDMTPGMYKGEEYDGVMRAIVGNHVALVEKGRAGPDVVVGDKALNVPLNKETDMAKAKVIATVKLPSRTALRLGTALAVSLSPMIAKDKALDITKVLVDVTAKNFKEKKADIAKLAKDGLEGLLTPEAQAAPAGAGPDDVIMRVLDMVDGQIAAAPAPELEADEQQPSAAAAPAAAAVDPDAPKKTGKDAIMEALKGKGMSEDDMAEIGGMFEPSAEDEDDKEKDDMVDKKAMDTAIAQARIDTANQVRVDMRELQEARDLVKPIVGDVALAHDTAEKVMRAALTALAVDGADKLHVDALKPVLLAQVKRKESAGDDSKATLASDSAVVKSLAERYPHAARISNLV